MVKVRSNMSYMLDKPRLEIPSPLSTRAALHATQLWLPVSSCHCKYMHIIENCQWVPLAHDTGAIPWSK